MSRVLASIALFFAVVCFCFAPPPGGSGGRSTGRSITPVPPAVTTPDQIANLFAWYKADALVTNTSGTVPPADNDNVKGWGDSSGNNRVLGTNNPTATGPKWRSAATTGKSQGAFEFASGSFIRVGWTAFNGSTVFAAWRNNTSGGTHMVCDSTNTGNRQSMYINSSDAFSCYSGNAFVTTGVAGHPTWNIQCTIFVNAGNDTIRTNGVVAISSSDSGSDTFDGLTVGSQWDGGNNLGTGDYVGEVIIYNRNLNSTECGQVEAYLNSRWNVY